MQFVNVVLVFGLVVAVLAAPVANAGVEILAPREAEAEANPRCMGGMACG